jgi:hypothetical protein
MPPTGPQKSAVRALCPQSDLRPFYPVCAQKLRAGADPTMQGWADIVAGGDARDARANRFRMT